MLYQSHPEYPHPCCIAPHRPECWEVRYLAVAHFGRVRGEWRKSEYPAFWLEAVTQAVSDRNVPLAKIWTLRDADCTRKRIGAALKPELEEIARVLLNRLHPKGPTG